MYTASIGTSLILSAIVEGLFAVTVVAYALAANDGAWLVFGLLVTIVSAAQASRALRAYRRSQHLSGVTRGPGWARGFEAARRTGNRAALVAGTLSAVFAAASVALFTLWADAAWIEWFVTGYWVVSTITDVAQYRPKSWALKVETTLVRQENQK